MECGYCSILTIYNNRLNCPYEREIFFQFAKFYFFPLLLLSFIIVSYAAYSRLFPQRLGLCSSAFMVNIEYVFWEIIPEPEIPSCSFLWLRTRLSGDVPSLLRHECLKIELFALCSKIGGSLAFCKKCIAFVLEVVHI